MQRHFWLGSVAWTLLWTAVGAAEPAKDDTQPEFVRLRRAADKRPVSLDTAIVEYRADDGRQVDLVGAIHVADRAYYDELNKLFKEYDAVLYELVAPEGAPIPAPGERRANPVSALQMGMKNLLRLEFQLDRVDYKRPNMVHADLSPKEFAESMSKRGESFTQMFFRMLGQSIAMQSKNSGASDFQLLAALLSKNRDQQLKRIMAEQLADNVDMDLFEGPDGSTIVTVRNERALEVMQREWKAGKQRVAIFYGAAHLPHMDRQLINKHGLKRGKQRWLAAWSLKADAPR